MMKINFGQSTNGCNYLLRSLLEQGAFDSVSIETGNSVITTKHVVILLHETSYPWVSAA